MSFLIKEDLYGRSPEIKPNLSKNINKSLMFSSVLSTFTLLFSMTGPIACFKQTVLTYIRAIDYPYAPDELRTRSTLKYLQSSVF